MALCASQATMRAAQALLRMHTSTHGRAHSRPPLAAPPCSLQASKHNTAAAASTIQEPHSSVQAQRASALLGKVYNCNTDCPRTRLVVAVLERQARELSERPQARHVRLLQAPALHARSALGVGARVCAHAARL